MPHTLFEQACEQSRGLATFDEVQALLADHIGTVSGTRDLKLEDALNAVLATDIIAPRDVPAFNNAAVDGYAFAHGELAANNHRLKISAQVFAGDAAPAPAGPGNAVRIFTGAVMPPDTDSCVMQENVTVNNGYVEIPPQLKAGTNCRKAGEDQKTGNVVVAAGTRLAPQHLGAIATTGTARITCRRAVKIALLSTGDEVIRPGSPLQPGQIYDSNFHLLSGLAAAAGLSLDDCGILADDEQAVNQTIERLSQSHDLIISTGGASVGDRDYVISAIERLGLLRSWKIAIKPGRPLAVGQVGKAAYLGLPGNPVAAFNTWLLFALPVIARLEGANWRPPQRFPLPAGFALPGKKTGRREFLRGRVEDTPHGPVAQKFDRDGSGLISGLTASTGLIEIAEDVARLEPGAPVSFIPFSQFGIAS